jgi:hypothetical protein
MAQFRFIIRGFTENKNVFCINDNRFRNMKIISIESCGFEKARPMKLKMPYSQNENYFGERYDKYETICEFMTGTNVQVNNESIDQIVYENHQIDCHLSFKLFTMKDEEYEFMDEESVLLTVEFS